MSRVTRRRSPAVELLRPESFERPHERRARLAKEAESMAKMKRIYEENLFAD